MKKLKDPHEPIERLFSRMRALGTHLGPVLYQLPPGWKVNRDRFVDFVDALPRDASHVVEFREPTWYEPEIEALMSPSRPRQKHLGHDGGPADFECAVPRASTGLVVTQLFHFVRRSTVVTPCVAVAPHVPPSHP